MFTAIFREMEFDVAIIVSDMGSTWQLRDTWLLRDVPGKLPVLKRHVRPCKFRADPVTATR